MSCSGAFWLKDGSYEKCSDTCKFEYKYDLDNTSQCKITKKGNYLDLNCWDRSTVVIGQDECSLQEMRLYSPPMNKWNTSTTVLGELILRHSSGAKNYYVCIPLKASSSDSGNGKEFFDSIEAGVNQFADSTSQVRIDLGGMYNLNNLIPKSKFYYSEGDGMDFDNNCLTSGSRIIIFPEEKHLGCSRNLISKIKSISKNDDPKKGNRREVAGSSGHIYDNNNQKTGVFLLNEEGTKTTAGEGTDPGSSMDITCEPIVDDVSGKNVLGGEEDSKFMSGALAKMDKKKMMSILYGVLIFIGSIFTLYVAYYLLYPNQIDPDPIKAQAGKMTNRVGVRIYKILHKNVT